MNPGIPSLLQLTPRLFARPWGGRRLAELYDPAAPEGPIGEAWLAADHAQGDSVIANMPGETLRSLMCEHPAAVAGTHVRLAPGGRFPVLLKLLHATEPLSVQVHPDDAWAEKLGEPDGGKTEMWHVLHAERDALVYRGFAAQETPDAVESAMRGGSLPALMTAIPMNTGDNVFVPARTVHAIGAGLLIAEIQQNSDLTYRMYDWGRTGADGQPRELHADKALQVSDWSALPPAPEQALGYNQPGCRRSVLGACPHFAAELWKVKEAYRWEPNGAWRLLLGIEGELGLHAGETEGTLRPNETWLIPACAGPVTLTGTGRAIAFYHPDFERDVRQPLEIAGHAAAAIAALWHA